VERYIAVTGGIGMNRLRGLSIVAVAVLGLILAGRVAVTAQEATPVPVAADLSTFSTTLLGILPGVTLPPEADLLAIRAELAPGVALPFTGGADAAATLIIVESGELAVTVTNQSWQISSETALNQAMASPTASGDLFALSTVVEPGEEGTLAVGDMTVIPATADGEMRNATMEPSTLLMIILGPGATSAATPVP
jgi:hypothetical protein